MHWLVFLRVVVSFFILGTSYILYSKESLLVVYGLVGVNVMVTLLSAIGIERLATQRGFILFHVYWDFLFVTALIFVSGGFYSLFSFMYILTIIFAAILTGQVHTVSVAAACSTFYGLILFGQYSLLIHPLPFQDESFSSPNGEEITVKILLNGLAFIISGILASYLAGIGKEADTKIRFQQQAMEELKILNENIVQSLPIGLITCDNDDLITFANSHAVSILGHAEGPLQGLNLMNLLPNLSDKDIGPIDVILDPDTDRGRRRILALNLAHLLDYSREVIGKVVSLQDVTSIRELEEVAKQADRQAVVGKLAAGIAHEIRNPLASVSGSIQVLRSELDLDPIHGHLMDIVLRETDRLNKLVTDFLVYARPSKKAETVADLSKVLEEQLGMLPHDKNFSARIQIVSKLEKGLICRFDPDQIRQLFWNLLINGMQAMDDQNGTLTVKSFLSSRHQGFIEVQISDTGPGIEAEVLSSIFDPFFTTKESGTGLGLTIAYRIAENHDGKILVDSIQGKGTTFHVLLPT